MVGGETLKGGLVGWLAGSLAGLRFRTQRCRSVGGSVLVLLPRTRKGEAGDTSVLSCVSVFVCVRAKERERDSDGGSDEIRATDERKGDQTGGTQRSSEQGVGHLITERVLLRACHKLRKSSFLVRLRMHPSGVSKAR